MSERTGSLAGATEPPRSTPVAAPGAVATDQGGAEDGRAAPPAPSGPAAPPWSAAPAVTVGAAPAPTAGSPEWGSQPAPFALSVTAALMGEYRWIENALYAVLGDWVNDMPVAAVQVHLDAQSQRHAWHADLWADRLPVLTGTDPAGMSVPSTATAALFAALEGATLDPDSPTVWLASDGSSPARPGALPRLAGLYRVVLPRLVTTYERHLRAVTDSATDAPVRRALRLVLNDAVEDWHTGERMVQRLVTRPHDVAAVHDFLRHLESAVVAAGARSGLVTLPVSVPEG